MTASQSQRKIYNPGQREDDARNTTQHDAVTEQRDNQMDEDGGYGEQPVEGPHHNRGDLERSREPGYQESHASGAPPHDRAVSPDGMQDPENIKSQETIQHTSQQRVGEDPQAPANIGGAPVNTVPAAVFTSAAQAGQSPAGRVDDAAPSFPDSSLTDAELLAAVVQRLKQAESLDVSAVRITVTHANVTLEGFVPHRFMQHAIEDVVDSCAGVREIDNRIRVRHRPGEDEPTLSIGV
ncbi:MAG: BON domain-containing protein [Pararobbsia sp.]